MREFFTEQKESSHDGTIEPTYLSHEDQQHIDDVLEKALKVDHEELIALKGRIEKNDGLLRVFVHPFYVADSPGRRSYLRTSNAQGYDAVEYGAYRHIDSALHNETAPLLVFEEASLANNTRQDIVSRAKDATDGVYVIPTRKDAGQLSVPFSMEVLKDLDWYREEHQRIRNQKETMLIKLRKTRESIISRGGTTKNEDALISEFEADLADPAYPLNIYTASDQLMLILLHGLGVRKLLVGGMFLSRDSQGSLGGCVAEVILAAKRLGIAVTVSKYHIDHRGRDTQGKLQGV